MVLPKRLKTRKCLNALRAPNYSNVTDKERGDGSAFKQRVKSLFLPQSLFSALRIPYRTSETRTDTCGQSTLCRFASVHLENVLVTTNLDEEKQLQHAGRFYLASKFLGVLSS